MFQFNMMADSMTIVPGSLKTIEGLKKGDIIVDLLKVLPPSQLLTDPSPEDSVIHTTYYFKRDSRSYWEKVAVSTTKSCIVNQFRRANMSEIFSYLMCSVFSKAIEP